MNPQVYLNGDLLDAARAAVNAANPSLLHGVGLFETLRTYEGRPFRLQQHLDRLRQSAACLDIRLGDTLEHVPKAIHAVLEANRLPNARVRFTVTPPAAHEDADRTTLLVAAQELTGYAPELYHQGMTIYLCNEYRQSRYDPLAGHKTTSYFPRLLALRQAQARHCGEALWFTPDNLVAEGCISNVFLVKNGKLRTPPLDTPVLPGVTRAAILELAHSSSISAEEIPCTINDLLDADEVFLTNAVMEVMPVTRIERRSIGNDKVGPLTRQLANAYRQLTAAG